MNSRKLTTKLAVVRSHNEIGVTTIINRNNHYRLFTTTPLSSSGPKFLRKKTRSANALNRCVDVMITYSLYNSNDNSNELLTNNKVIFHPDRTVGRDPGDGHAWLGPADLRITSPHPPAPLPGRERGWG
jgi:hypothetical protein